MITIVRVGSPLKPGVHREYCGRAGKGEAGLLGNPFAANVTHSNRDEVCDKFQEFFDKAIELKGVCGQVDGWDKQLKVRGYETYWAMRRLYKIALVQDVELACFCVPKRCHCLTIKNFLDKVIGERE